MNKAIKRMYLLDDSGGNTIEWSTVLTEIVEVINGKEIAGDDYQHFQKKLKQAEELHPDKTQYKYTFLGKDEKVYTIKKLKR